MASLAPASLAFSRMLAKFTLMRSGPSNRARNSRPASEAGDALQRAANVASVTRLAGAWTDSGSRPQHRTVDRTRDICRGRGWPGAGSSRQVAPSRLGCPVCRRRSAASKRASAIGRVKSAPELCAGEIGTGAFHRQVASAGQRLELAPSDRPVRLAPVKGAAQSAPASAATAGQRRRNGSLRHVGEQSGESREPLHDDNRQRVAPTKPGKRAAAIQDALMGRLTSSGPRASAMRRSRTRPCSTGWSCGMT